MTGETPTPTTGVEAQEKAPEKTWTDNLKKAGEFLSSMKAIATFVAAMAVLLWGVLENFSSKLDAINSVKQSIVEINSNVLVLSTTTSRISEKTERLTENMLSNDRKYTILEERVRAVDDKLRRAVDINKQIPFKFVDTSSNNATDAPPGGVIFVTLTYDIYRNDCKSSVERIVKDADDVSHNVTDSITSSFDNPFSIWQIGTGQTIKYAIRLPPADIMKKGNAKFQSRIHFSCADGGQFFAWSPYINFRVLDK